MSFVIWTLLGGLLGWGASALMGIGERRAVIENVVIGVAGVMFAGWLLGGIIGTSVFALGDYSISGLLVALLGATVPLAAVQMLRIRRVRTRNLNPGESVEMNHILRASSALRPVLAAGLAGVLLLFAACASAPPAPESALIANPPPTVAAT